MKRLFLLIGLLFFGLSIVAQEKYFHLKGSVVSADSLSPIPDVHILSMLSYYGTTSDFNGKFSILTRKNDTLRISCVGFVTQFLPLNHDTIDSDNFKIMVERDTVMLQEVDIFPYLDYQEIEEIISKNHIIIHDDILRQSEININIANYYYNKTKDLPKTRAIPFVIYNPIKKLYDRFNKKERLKRKMERNRKRLGIEE